MRALIAIAAVCFVFLQYRLWLGEGNVQGVWELRKQVDDARLKTQTLVERNRALYADVSDLKSGLEAVEEIARTDLGMIRKGEVFFQVVGAPEEQAALDDTPLVTDEED